MFRVRFGLGALHKPFDLSKGSCCWMAWIPEF